MYKKRSQSLKLFHYLFCVFILACSSKMDYNALYEKANQEIDKENYSGAMKYLDKALQIHYSADSLYTLKSYCLFQTGHFREAIEEAEKSMMYKPENDYAYYLSAISKRNLNLVTQVNLNSAESDMTYVDGQIVRKYKVITNGVNSITEVYNMQAVLLDLNKAIELNTNNADNYMERARTYEEMGLDSKAMIDYNSAITLNGNNAEFYFRRALLYKQLEKTQESLSDFNKALSLKEDALYYANRGYLKREQLNDPDGCCEDFRKAESLGMKMEACQ